MIRHRVRGHRKELTVWAERVTRRRRKTITATTKTRPASASTTARRMTGGVRPAAQTTASTSIPQTNSDAAITAVACKNSRARWERCHLSSCSADATGSLTIGSPVPCPGGQAATAIGSYQPFARIGPSSRFAAQVMSLWLAVRRDVQDAVEAGNRPHSAWPWRRSSWSLPT